MWHSFPRTVVVSATTVTTTSSGIIGLRCTTGSAARLTIPRYHHQYIARTHSTTCITKHSRYYYYYPCDSTTSTISLVPRLHSLPNDRIRWCSSNSWVTNRFRSYHAEYGKHHFGYMAFRIWNIETRKIGHGKVGWTMTTRLMSNSTSTVAIPNKSRWWSRFAIMLRYVRIPVLIVSVYSLGYQQGIIDCIKEPIALQNQILNGILLSTGCTSIDDVTVINDKDIKYHSFRRPDQVAIVGHKIIAAARDIVEAKLQDAMIVVKSKLPNDISPENELLAMSSDPTVQFYYNARLRINGEQVENAMWQYIFIKSSTPNAFVTEVLPRKFFITTAMLQVATTPDELAIVLGHEISHLILGHVSSTNGVETFLRTIEILLLSMDPTAGVLAVFVIGAIYAARRLVSAAYSRENEIEADDLGIEIAAAACYDTIAGCKVMYKMHQVSNDTALLSGSNSNTSGVVDAETLKAPSSISPAIAHLMDTHPPSLDRYERMLASAKNGENYTKYVNCANIRQRFLNLLWGTKIQTSTGGGNDIGATNTDTGAPSK